MSNYCGHDGNHGYLASLLPHEKPVKGFMAFSWVLLHGIFMGPVSLHFHGTCFMAFSWVLPHERFHGIFSWYVKFHGIFMGPISRCFHGAMVLDSNIMGHEMLNFHGIFMCMYT